MPRHATRQWERDTIRNLKLKNLFKLNIGALVHKIRYQKRDVPPALYDLVQPALAVNNYNTRYATNQNLYSPFSRTNYWLSRFIERSGITDLGSVSL